MMTPKVEKWATTWGNA